MCVCSQTDSQVKLVEIEDDHEMRKSTDAISTAAAEFFGIASNGKAGGKK